MERRQVVIGLTGPKAASILKTACAPFGALQPGKWAQGSIDGAQAICARPGAKDWYLLFVRPDEVVRAWTKLKAAGAVPAGARAREAAKRDEAKPDLTKPYFVGCRKVAAAPAKKEKFLWKEYEGPIKKSCLWAQHQEKDAKGAKGRMVPFAGWEMPV